MDDLARRETTEFIIKNLPTAAMLERRYGLLEQAHRHAGEGLIAEFGVGKGKSINLLASKTDRPVHGFDSCRGLPESWHGLQEGHFDRSGDLPEVANTAVTHGGWFEDTIPDFLEKHKETFAFIHVDCDLYSSTKTVLMLLNDRIVDGTLI